MSDLAKMKQTLLVKCQEIIQESVNMFVSRNLTTGKVFKDLLEYQA